MNVSKRLMKLTKATVCSVVIYLLMLTPLIFVEAVMFVIVIAFFAATAAISVFIFIVEYTSDKRHRDMLVNLEKDVAQNIKIASINRSSFVQCDTKKGVKR